MLYFWKVAYCLFCNSVSFPSVFLSNFLQWALPCLLELSKFYALPFFASGYLIYLCYSTEQCPHPPAYLGQTPRMNLVSICSVFAAHNESSEKGRSRWQDCAPGKYISVFKCAPAPLHFLYALSFHHNSAPALTVSP